MGTDLFVGIKYRVELEYELNLYISRRMRTNSPADISVALVSRFTSALVRLHEVVIETLGVLVTRHNLVTVLIY